MIRMITLSCVVVSLLLTGCTDDDCEPLRVVVTDIDETLTTSDGEWILQIVNPEHDPEMRPDANTLMSAYEQLGYRIVYITARGEEIELADGTTARQASSDWLVEHGFPYAEENLFLYPGLTGDDEETIEYKAGVIEELVADGWTVDFAYGNAETDIEAFLQAGVPSERVFLVGRLAGTMDVESIYDEDAFTNHMESYFSTIGEASCD